MPGVLLDTHALFWLVSGTDQLTDGALLAIGESQEAGTLLVSPITAWELSLAAKKPPHRNPPNLGEVSPSQWFRDAVRVTDAKLVPIRQRIALEAADVATTTGHGDPGDCFLIATSRVQRVALVTRDVLIRDIAHDIPNYLSVIVC